MSNEEELSEEDLDENPYADDVIFCCFNISENYHCCHFMFCYRLYNFGSLNHFNSFVDIAVQADEPMEGNDDESESDDEVRWDNRVHDQEKIDSYMLV